MTHFLVLLLALLIGVVAGLRALTPPAVVAWAAMLLLAGASAQAQDTPPLQVAQAATALPAVTVTATLTEQDARTAAGAVQ